MSSYRRRSYATTISRSSSSSNSESEASGESNPSNEFFMMEGFPYPPCWENDANMNLLMSPFRLRSIDPRSYEAKMEFWQGMIRRYCMYKRNASFSKRELQLVFRRGKRIPYCFDTVLEEMLISKQIRLRSDYECDPINTWTGWAVNKIVWRPLGWALQKIPIFGGPENPDQVEYIHLAVMQKFAEELEKILHQQEGQIQHYVTLVQELQEKLTEDCIKLCLHTLHSERKIGLEYITRDNKKEIHLIKVPAKSDSSVEITQIDRAKHSLQMTQKNLLQQLEVIEKDIKVYQERARQNIKDGQRQLAKAYLRKKVLLEKSHEKRSVALHNVESLLYNVEEAQTNGVILDAYKIGSKALQEILTGSGLKYDNVDEVISDVRDTIETHDDLQESLSGANMGIIADEDALERELREIVAESTADGTLSTKANTLSNDKITTKAHTPVVTSSPAVNKVVTATTSTPVDKSAPALESRTINTNLQTAEISDAELLAMLDNLEVEDDSPTKATKNNAAANI